MYVCMYYIFSTTNLRDFKYNNNQDKRPVYTCISQGLPMTTIFPLRAIKLLKLPLVFTLSGILHDGRSVEVK